MRTTKPSPLVIAFAAGAVILVATGSVLLASYVRLSRQPSAEGERPTSLEVVRPDAVAPDLAVLPLAGEDEERILRAALGAREVETALAILTHSVLLPDSSRGGAWLLLARYLEKGDPDRARIAYRSALDLASLAAYLNDATRADLSLQAARGLNALDSKPLALAALGQAESIAQGSTTLLPAQRRDVMDSVLDAYRAMGVPNANDRLRRELEAVNAAPDATVDVHGPLLPLLRGSVVLPPQLGAAIVARQQAAARMAAQWLATDESQRPALADDLSKALVAEDQLRSTFYADPGSLEPADRLALKHDEIAWLSTKRQVARKAFGASLVPGWETSQQEIALELQQAYTDLINGYGQLLDGLPGEQPAQAKVELLRQALLWARLGLLSGDVEDTLGEQLQAATLELRARHGDAGLVIAMQDVEGERSYLLQDRGATEP